jgi:hypothetical protein
MERVAQPAEIREEKMKYLKYAILLSVLLVLAACGQVQLSDPELGTLDNTVADGDEAVPVASNTLNFGNVCEGATVSKTPLIAIERDRGGTADITFKNSTNVTVTVTGTTGTGVSASMGSPNTITIPNGWSGSSHGTMSPAVSSTVTLAAGNTRGSFSGTVSYRASGLNAAPTSSATTINRDTNLPVSWTVISCATPNTAPTKPGAPTLSSGSNPNNSGEFTLSWTASTDTESNPITYLLQHQNAGGGWDTVASGLTTNSYAFISTYPEGEGAWKYRVQASDGLLSSAFSDASVSIVVDKTAPTTNDNAPNGWQSGNVTVTLSATDNTGGSGVASTFYKVGADSFTAGTSVALTTEGVHTITYYSVDNAGNAEAEKTATVSVDKTAPTISSAAVKLDSSGNPAGAYTASSWTNQSVRVSFTCEDSLSDVDSTASNIAGSDVTNEGAGQSANSTGSCVDNAGNTSSGASFANINIDKTAPSVAYTSASPAANTVGWHKDNVTATFTATDNLSGFGSSASMTVTGTATTSGEGRGVTVGSPAFTDNAGNSAVAGAETSAGFNIDTSAPNPPTAATDRTPEDAVGGWFRNTVTVGYSSTDPDLADGSAGSGIASPGTNQTFNTSNTHSYSGLATDNAGNVSNATTGTVKVDATKPSVNLTCPTSPILLGSTASANWNASDAHSGLATPANGSIALDTRSVGSKMASAPAGTASDRVGLESDASNSCSYNVVYSHSSILQPINTAPVDPMSVFKINSTVPVKVQLTGGSASVTNAVITIAIARQNNSLVGDWTDEGVVSTAASTTGNLLRYDASSNQYIFNLGTKSLSAGTYRITLSFDDGTTTEAFFGLRK